MISLCNFERGGWLQKSKQAQVYCKSIMKNMKLHKKEQSDDAALLKIFVLKSCNVDVM